AAWILTMDNSALWANVPQWAGGGTGGTGPKDLTQFTTGELTAYKVMFDAKTKGAAAASATCVLQVLIDAADDTLQPADDNTDNDLLARLDFQVADLTAEFQTYTLTLNKGTAGDGSKENLTQHFDKIVNVPPQWQIENAPSEATWGFDADNAFVVDNFKMERIYTGLPPVTVTSSGGQISVDWGGTSNVKLQSTTSLTGTWGDVSNPSNPHKVTPTPGETRFFRTVLVP